MQNQEACCPSQTRTHQRRSSAPGGCGRLPVRPTGQPATDGAFTDAQHGGDLSVSASRSDSSRHPFA